MSTPTITKELHQYTLRLAAPETEFDAEFPQMMANRMAVSYLKYGPLADGYPDRVDAIASLHQRLDEYARTGNTEALVDAANYCMIEFMHPRHPAAYFAATDSDGSPGRTRVDGSVDAGRNNARPAKQKARR